MRRQDKIIISLVLVLAVALFGGVQLVRWMKSSSEPAATAPSPTAAVETSPAVAESAAPTGPATPEGVSDYSGVLTTTDPAIAQLTGDAALKLAEYHDGESKADRQKRLDGLVDQKLVGSSPWTEALKGSKGASVTASLISGPTSAGTPGAATVTVSVPIQYVIHLPKRDGETTASGSAAWTFEVDTSTPGSPKITKMTEPTGL